MMHSTLGVGEAFAAKRDLHPKVSCIGLWLMLKPFRMPDFFMLAGLFLSYAIGRGWLHYLDKKVLHFAYFYVISGRSSKQLSKQRRRQVWTRQDLHQHSMEALVSPYPTLWFIYMSATVFRGDEACCKAVPAWALLAGAALIHTLPVHTGWSAVDHFAVHYYVFFLGGYLLAPYIFQTAAEWAQTQTHAKALAGRCGLGGPERCDGLYAEPDCTGWATIAELPVISILLGGMGAMAIVLLASAAVEVSASRRFIKYCGANSIVLYISFTIPMALTRVDAA